MSASRSLRPRRVAWRVLRAAARGQRLDRALETRVRSIPARDRRWIRTLTYGVARLRGRLDFVIARHTHRRLKRLDPNVLDLLRMGAYQLHCMDGVPPYAAVASTVALARETGASASAGLVNAVLLAVARSSWSAAAFPSPAADPEGHLTEWHSHLRWLVRRWRARWGFAATEKLVRHNNRIPALYLRLLGMRVGPALQRLEEVGVAAEEAGEGIGCLRLAPGSEPARVLAAVPGVIQDPGAALVAAYAAPPRGSLVADLCAAPGGKALVLSERAGYVAAADLSPSRLCMVREGARRLAAPVGCVVASANAPPFRRADLVLADVPCSGTGTLARRPDIRWRLRENDVRDFARLQRRILRSAARVVPSGDFWCTPHVHWNPKRTNRWWRAF